MFITSRVLCLLKIYNLKKIKEKILNSTNTVLAESKICPTHKPLYLGYLDWHTEVEKRHRKGMKQKQCEVCKRWLWKDEM